MEPQFLCEIDMTPVMEMFPALGFFPYYLGEAGVAMAVGYIECSGSPDGLEDWMNRDSVVISLAGAVMWKLSGDEWWGRSDRPCRSEAD